MLNDATPSLKAIQHAPMHEVVYDRLKEALFSGDLIPGQKLVIRDLAETLGTSVMPVREALRRLEAENAVAAIGGRTLCVPILSSQEYEELSIIRAELEGCAAYHAAQKITDEEITRLQTYAQAIDQAALDRNASAIAQNNRLFHETINRACQLPLLLRMIESVWLRFGPQITYALKNGMVEDDWDKDVSGIFNPHHRALDAFKARDALSARAAVQYDINSVNQIIVASMKRAEEKAGYKNPAARRKKKKPVLQPIAEQ